MLGVMPRLVYVYWVLNHFGSDDPKKELAPKFWPTG